MGVVTTTTSTSNMHGTHGEEPGAGVQALQLRPREHGRRSVRPVGEGLVHVGGASQRVVVHQERDAVNAAAATRRQLDLQGLYLFYRVRVTVGPVKWRSIHVMQSLIGLLKSQQCASSKI